MTDHIGPRHFAEPVTVTIEVWMYQAVIRERDALRAEVEKLRQERDAVREAEGGIEFCGLCGGYHPLGNKSFVGRIFDNPCAREEKGGA